MPAPMEANALDDSRPEESHQEVPLESRPDGPKACSHAPLNRGVSTPRDFMEVKTPPHRTPRDIRCGLTGERVDALEAELRRQILVLQVSVDGFMEMRDKVGLQIYDHQQRLLSMLEDPEVFAASLGSDPGHGLDATEQFKPSTPKRLDAVRPPRLDVHAAERHPSFKAEPAAETTGFDSPDLDLEEDADDDINGDYEPLAEQRLSQNASMERYRESADQFLAAPWQARSLGMEATFNTASHWGGLVHSATTHTLGHVTFRTKSFVQSTKYEVFMGLVIILNAAYIGWDVQYALENQSDELDKLYIGAFVFIVIYSLDLGARLAVFRRDFFRPGPDFGFNMFDSGVVAVMLFEQVLRVITVVNKQEQEEYKTIGMLRMVRLLRLIRILHIVRFLKFFREFRLLAYSMHKALTALFWVMVIDWLYVYLFAVGFSQGALEVCFASNRHEPVCQNFGTLFDTILTLYKAMLHGLLWGDLLDQLRDFGVIYPILFIFFVTFNTLIILNLVTGVLLEILNHISKNEQETMIRDMIRGKQEYIQKMERIFRQLDVNDSGGISWDEFQLALKDQRMIALLESLELELSDATQVFVLLDRDKTGSIEIEEFILGCMHLKGDARTLDVMKIQVQADLILQTVRSLQGHIAHGGELAQGEMSQLTSPLFALPSTPFSTPFSTVPSGPLSGTHSGPVSTSGTSSMMRGRQSIHNSSPQLQMSMLLAVDPYHFIDSVEERSMTLKDLRKTLDLVKEGATQGWQRDGGKRLRLKEVNLYDFNFHHIGPSTVPHGVELLGLHGVNMVSKGAKVTQRISNSEGYVQEHSNGNTVKIKVTRGRFWGANEAGGEEHNVLVDGEDAGVPSEVKCNDGVTVSHKEMMPLAEPTKPSWFCSHWWGEAIIDFVSCCEQHALLRKIPQNQATYWVCAYANRQHDLSADISDDPDNSSFRKAMRAAKGVLLVLDPAATPFSRIWCDFELYHTLSDGKPLDVVTSSDGTDNVPQLLSQNPLPGEAAHAKMHREERFPLSLIAVGLHARLEDGKASVEADKQRILVCMARDKATGKQGDENDLALALNRANSTLHSYLALAAWPQAIKKSCVKDFDPTKPGTLCLADILAQDEWMETLNLSLSNLIEVRDSNLAIVAKGLPSRLVQLRMSFEGCAQITDSGLLSLAQKLPLGLQGLYLDFLGCKFISDQGIANLATRLPPGLQDLRLDFATCEKVGMPGIKVLAENLPPNLARFHATFQGTEVDRKFESTKEITKFAGVKTNKLSGFIRKTRHSMTWSGAATRSSMGSSKQFRA